jgi:hypothetical protein
MQWLIDANINIIYNLESLLMAIVGGGASGSFSPRPVLPVTVVGVGWVGDGQTV